jgi:hypothetical protein
LLNPSGNAVPEYCPAGIALGLLGGLLFDDPGGLLDSTFSGPRSVLLRLVQHVLSPHSLLRYLLYQAAHVLASDKNVLAIAVIARDRRHRA